MSNPRPAGRMWSDVLNCDSRNRSFFSLFFRGSLSEALMLNVCEQLFPARQRLLKMAVSSAPPVGGAGPCFMACALTGLLVFTGLIRLRSAPLPRLQGLDYVLNVTATDDNASGGPRPLSSTAIVIVGVDDVNNNKPVFEAVRICLFHGEAGIFKLLFLRGSHK